MRTVDFPLNVTIVKLLTIFLILNRSSTNLNYWTMLNRNIKCGDLDGPLQGYEPSRFRKRWRTLWAILWRRLRRAPESSSAEKVETEFWPVVQPRSTSKPTTSLSTFDVGVQMKPQTGWRRPQQWGWCLPAAVIALRIHTYRLGELSENFV